MSDIAISAEYLGKMYMLRHRDTAARYQTLRESLVDGVQHWWGNAARAWRGERIGNSRQEEFWALHNINFDIRVGEVVGVIGRNGAGKSTLLKVLSRITEPTRGRVRIRGRVASLLEVGTGFHPELTGRENIFLNGAILGMTRTEIQGKFDEIVAFAEIEKFLDTPVKRYSSGMYVRLAFAVAAHLEAEILMIDEVLAVGDAAFQKKCLGKMGDVAQAGRTILFVSHNMGPVSQLCHKAMLLDGGTIQCFGDVGQTIGHYLSDISLASAIELEHFKGSRRGLREFAEIKSIAIFDTNRQPTTVFGMGETLAIRLGIHCKKHVNGAIFGIMLRNSIGILIHDFRSAFDGFFPAFAPGLNVLEVTVPTLSVYPGQYTIGAWIQQQIGIASDDYVNDALKISIIDKKLLGDANANFEIISKEGAEVYHPCTWRMLSPDSE